MGRVPRATNLPGCLATVLARSSFNILQRSSVSSGLAWRGRKGGKEGEKEGREGEMEGGEGGRERRREGRRAVRVNKSVCGY